MRLRDIVRANPGPHDDVRPVRLRPYADPAHDGHHCGPAGLHVRGLGLRPVPGAVPDHTAVRAGMCAVHVHRLVPAAVPGDRARALPGDVPPDRCPRRRPGDNALPLTSRRSSTGAPCPRRRPRYEGPATSTFATTRVGVTRTTISGGTPLRRPYSSARSAPM